MLPLVDRSYGGELGLVGASKGSLDSSSSEADMANYLECNELAEIRTLDEASSEIMH